MFSAHCCLNKGDTCGSLFLQIRWGHYRRPTVKRLKLPAVILLTTGKTTKIKINYIAWLPLTCDQAFFFFAESKKVSGREKVILFPSPFKTKRKQGLPDHRLGCHNQRFLKFPDFFLTCVKFPWPTELTINFTNNINPDNDSTIPSNSHPLHPFIYAFSKSHAVYMNRYFLNITCHSIL